MALEFVGRDPLEYGAKPGEQAVERKGGLGVGAAGDCQGLGARGVGEQTGDGGS